MFLLDPRDQPGQNERRDCQEACESQGAAHFVMVASCCVRHFVYLGEERTRVPEQLFSGICECQALAALTDEELDPQ